MTRTCNPVMDRGRSAKSQERGSPGALVNAAGMRWDTQPRLRRSPKQLRKKGIGVLPIIRTSERSSFKRCPQQWVWGWVEGLRLPEEQEGFNAATFGTGIHLALAEYYVPGRTRGADPRSTWKRFIGDQRATIRTLDDDGVAHLEDAADLGDVMLTEYLKEYGADSDWEVIAPEMTFSVPIPDKEGNPVGIFSGTIDLVVRQLSDRRLFITDHKTCQGIPGSFDWLNLDDQATGYQAVATHVLRDKGLIGPKESVRGMIYNYLRKARPDERPVNELGQATNKPQKKHYIEQLSISGGFNPKWGLEQMAQFAANAGIQVLGDVSKVQPTPNFHREVVERTAAERRTTIRRLGEEIQWMEAVRGGKLPVVKRTSPDCKFCSFFEMCCTDEQGHDIEDYKQMVYIKHDPYADHRDGAINSKTSVENKIVTGVK